MGLVVVDVRGVHFNRGVGVGVCVGVSWYYSIPLSRAVHPESGRYILVSFFVSLSVGAIVVLVVHVLFHMDSWAHEKRKGSFTKPKLCPAFKHSIVVSQRKTN